MSVTTATANDVLTALRDELVNRGLVRRPSVAAPATPAHVEPLGGAPAPGDKAGVEDDPGLVLTLRMSGYTADAPYAPTRTVIVDVLYRSRTTAGLKRGRDLDAAIVEAIVRRPDYGYGWLMGDVPGPGLLVVSSAVYGGLGRIGIDETGTVDELAKYAFETL
jgi:hypothetical protein